MDKDIQDELEYYRRKEELYKYAREFQLQLAKDGFFELMYMDLNIHFVNGFNIRQMGIFKACQGDLIQIPVIKIYGVDYLDMTSLKKSIRHEMLHHVLWIFNIPNTDDDPEFHAVCKIYKAGAYMKVPKEQIEYCNDLKQLSKEELLKKLLNGYMKCQVFEDEVKQETPIEVGYYEYVQRKVQGMSDRKTLFTNLDVQRIKRDVI